MREVFVGFDSAWTGKSPGGIVYATFEQDRLHCLPDPELVCFDKAAQIIKRLRNECQYVLVAIDQPTLVPNCTGMRPVERVAASLISRLRSGVQPANRGKREMFGPDAPIWKFLECIGARENPPSARTAKEGLHLMEVFPALALPALEPAIMERKRAARYNPKNKNFSLRDWKLVASAVRCHADALHLKPLSRWASEAAKCAAPKKKDQDCLDAAICLLIALYWRRAPRDCSIVIGDAETGYMVTPVSSESREILEEAADRKHVQINGPWPRDIEAAAPRRRYELPDLRVGDPNRELTYRAAQVTHAGTKHLERVRMAPERNTVGRHILTLKACDIERWAESSPAREHLPVLLRKLVHATGRDLKHVDFPGFDNSQRPGWDGWVEASTATAWIPEGVSGWEFGTSQRPGQKAQKDYNSRLRLPLEERESCTFVFVTPRNWQGKNKWAKRKEASGDGWKAVRAYDASDLEQWLEESEVASLWLAENLSTPIEGIGTLEAHWKIWARASEPPMTQHIFESTIATHIEQFKKWLEAPPEDPFIVAADSQAEALAFLRCLFQHEEIPSGQRDLAAVFESPQALTAWAKSSSQFIPIAANTQTQQQLPFLRKRMHCIITCPRNAVNVKPDITLELLGYGAFAEALKTMGLNRHEIDRLAKESGKSPTILRRRLASVPAIRTPQWASETALANMLIPLGLIGVWHKHSKADQEVLSTLADYSYEDIEKNITRLMLLEDCPVWAIDQHTGVASKIDVLFSVAPLMTEQNIDSFLTLAEYVLSESDPALNLPEEERWAAAVYGKLRDHSPTLRNGICETLVLLSVHGNDLFAERMGVDIAGQVSVLVNRLLTPLEERLQSQERDLPAYAEAAPDRFLSILEEDLAKNDPVVLRLLKPATSLPFGNCPRAGLLWALECMAWNPAYLSRVCILLAKLSKTEIEDNWSNKPFTSLSGILRSWMPQTAASLDERIAVLKMLAGQFPAVGWQLCLGEIWSGPRYAMDNYRPQWRSDASGAGGLATQSDAGALIQCAIRLLLDWPSHNQGTLGDLVEQIEAFSESQQSTIWDLIDAWVRRQEDEEVLAKLRERIRRFALTSKGIHNRQSTIDRARLTYERLEPRNLIFRHAWLFAQPWIEELQDGLVDQGLNFEARHRRIDKLRQTAMKEIWTAHALGGILKMVEKDSHGHTVGHYAAACAIDVVSALQACLSREDSMARFDAFMRAFILARTNANPANLKLLLKVSRQVSQDQSDRLWRCAPFKAETWRLMDGLPEDVQTRYWRKVSPLDHQFTEAECAEVIDRLLAAERPWAAFAAMTHQWENVETGCFKRLLMALASGTAREGAVRIDTWHISNALEALGTRPGVAPHEMARFEFTFIDALNSRRHGIPNLEKQLAESPAFFVEALSHCFKRKDGGQDPEEWQIDDDARRRDVAGAAHKMLRQTARIPGTEADGSINVDALLRWLKEARGLCAQVGRVEIGDLMIGELLSKAPAEEDSTWPCRAVCEALDTVASEDIARGLIIGKRNARGVVTRSVDEGGNQERELAEKYQHWAQVRRVDYPFASRAINNIATSYERDAEHQDTQSKLDKRLDL